MEKTTKKTTEKKTTAPAKKRGPKPPQPGEVRELCPHCGRPMPRKKTYTPEQIATIERRAALAEERAVKARARLAAINGAAPVAMVAEPQAAPVVMAPAAPVAAPVGMGAFRRSAV